MTGRLSRGLWVAGLAAALAAGVAIGLIGFTFVYAKGFSYLGNDPTVCTNCHLMRDQYEAWSHGSHRQAAKCKDCHMPDFLPAEMALEGWNGARHALMFTTGWHVDYPFITKINRLVVEGQCRSCHGRIVQAIDADPGYHMKLDCARCHRSAGHLE